MDRHVIFSTGILQDRYDFCTQAQARHAVSKHHQCIAPLYHVAAQTPLRHRNTREIVQSVVVAGAARHPLGKDLRSRVLDHHKDVYYRVRLANFSLQSTSILTLVTNHSFLTQRHKTTPPISILPLTTPFSLSSRRLLICTPPTRETSAAKSALF